jgi:1,2-diacylglycerol 3-alpha-glucosyltransferase
MTSTRTPPRVLMISDVYFPRVNGVSTSIQTFRNDLGRLGVESWLVAPEYPAARADEPGIVRVRSRYLPLDPEDRIMVGAALERECRALAVRCDLVHVQTPFLAHRVGVRVARRLGLPVLESYHTYFEQYFHHYLPFLPASVTSRIARRISRTQCNAVDAVVAPSPQMAAALDAYGVDTPIEVIATGLDLGKFRGGDGTRFRRARAIAAERPVLLNVGRVAFEKNLVFLIDVLERVKADVPDVLLVIAGEGPALHGLAKLVARRHLAGNVLFVGYLDRGGALLDCYRSADAFVFASRTETQGLVLLEALALGVPVVSTAVMGTKTVLEGARGAIVVEEDRDAFAAAVVSLLADRAYRARLAAEGPRYIAANWSGPEMAARMCRLYERLIAAVRQARAG